MNFSDNPRTHNSRRATLRARSLRATLASLLFACLIASNLAPARAQAQAVAPDPTAKIDEYMNAVIKAENFNGSILVARRGGPVVARGYGMADFEGRVPNTSKTRFRIGSLTKQFTAAAVLLLQERGKLSVGDSVCKYVEPCPAAWQPVRIHHLLSHTAGIPNFTSFPDYRTSMDKASLPASTIARFRDRPLEFQPGESHKYSNSGYVLLGYVIERVSGQPYGAFLRANVFKPLKMENTGYDDASASAGPRAKGYRVGPGGAPAPAEHIDMTIPHAAGALYSTVEDLHLWDQALNSDKVLKKASLDAMFTPVRDDYAYGWRVARQEPGRTLHAHGGGINGFTSYIARYPADGVTVVVLANLEGGVSSSRVARDLAAIVYGEKYELPVVRVYAKVDPKIYDSYVGEYELAPGMTLAITREGDSLMAQPTGQRKIEIFPTSETVFSPKVIRAEITFARDAAGQVTHLVFSQGGRQQTAKKIK